MNANIDRGAATREQYDEYQRLWNEWRDHPGAFGAFAWGEAIGRKS